MQSTRQETATGLHVAIVMDGNGRWATARGLPRRRGHEAGARTVRTIVEAAPPLGIGLLTLYAFSADNWKRPRREVGALLALFRRYLESECARLRDAGIRLSIIGRRDRGSIEVGTTADVIVVNGNPLFDIMALSRVVGVVKDGVVYKGGPATNAKPRSTASAQ